MLLYASQLIIIMRVIWISCAYSQDLIFPQLPCPDIFYYSNNGGKQSWMGYFILKNYDTNNPVITIKMNFSISAQLNVSTSLFIFYFAKNLK